MHGFEFCKNLKREKPNQAVVILTGKGSENMAVLAIKAGVDDYVVKDSKGSYLQILPVVLSQALNHINTLRGIIQSWVV